MTTGDPPTPIAAPPPPSASSPAPAASSPTPASPSPGEKPARGPCCLLGCAFGCVFPLLAFLVGLILFFWLGDPWLARLRARAALPDAPRVLREDRWGLADKVKKSVQEAATQDSELVLTLGEANALLQRWDPVPTRGFALARAWLMAGTGKPVLVLAGSGFWMRSLTIAVELSGGEAGGAGFVVTRILINSAELSEGWSLRAGCGYLERFLEQTTGLSAQDLNGGRFRITIGSDTVTLQGPLKTFPLLKGFTER